MSHPHETPFHRGLMTYRGSCACGAVRYEVDLDLSEGTTRCNCTHCTKLSWWGARTRPGKLRLLSGQESLGDFSRSEYAHGRFCKVCGTRCFGHGDIPEIGGEYCSINLNTLDGAALAGVHVDFIDGLHDTWDLLKSAPYVHPFASASRASSSGS